VLVLVLLKQNLISDVARPLPAGRPALHFAAPQYSQWRPFLEQHLSVPFRPTNNCAAQAEQRRQYDLGLFSRRLLEQILGAGENASYSRQCAHHLQKKWSASGGVSGMDAAQRLFCLQCAINTPMSRLSWLSGESKSRAS
jgi:hypothetical protein